MSTTKSTSNLNPKQRRHLKGLGHHLNAIVTVGKEGISDTVVSALEEALLQHELVKVRVGNSSELDRHEVAEELAKRSKSWLTSVLGKTILLYKAHPDKPVIKLPKK